MLAKLRKKGLPVSAAAALLAALVLTALLCLPFAAAMCREALPLTGVQLWSVLAAGLSVMIATLVTARLRGRQALPTGAIVAGGYIVLAALACALGGADAAFGPWLWQLGAAVLAGGLLGAFMSIRQKSHKKRRK